MIDIGRGDQENFEKKNCGQSPQKIRNKSGINPLREKSASKKIQKKSASKIFFSDFIRN